MKYRAFIDFIIFSRANSNAWYYTNIPGYRLKFRENPIYKLYWKIKSIKTLREHWYTMKTNFYKRLGCKVTGHKLFLHTVDNQCCNYSISPGVSCSKCNRHDIKMKDEIS